MSSDDHSYSVTSILKQEELDRLISRMKSGDDGAFYEIYMIYYPVLYRYSFKLLDNKEDAKDATQESFVQIHRDIHTLSTNVKFSSWILSIAHRRCMDIHRKRKKNKRVIEKVKIIDRTIFNTAPPASEEVEKKEVQQIVRRTINQLPEAQKSIVVLFYLQGLSLKEISEIERTSVLAVKSKLFRARKTILTKMEDAGHSSFKNLISIITLALVLDDKQIVTSAVEVEKSFSLVKKLLVTPKAKGAISSAGLLQTSFRAGISVLEKITLKTLSVFLIAGSAGTMCVASVPNDHRLVSVVTATDCTVQLVEKYEDGNVSSDVTQTVGSDEIASALLTIDPVDSHDAVLTGTGEPGKRIQVILPNEETLSGVISPDGTWMLDLPSKLHQGDTLVVKVFEDTDKEEARIIIKVG